MITRLINKLLGKPGNPAAMAQGRRVEIAASVHRIDPSLLDERAVHVVKALQHAGHEAYVVGGAVRDLLVGRRPKDFDVATDATPEQVKSLFRRAFIIGRRFRIVHVVFGRGRDHEVIEVSTFRAFLDSAAAQTVEGNERTAKSELAGKSHAVDASGRVLRDNVWGPQIEDAARRDFTINAMYYDPVTEVLIDYHGGLSDVRARVLRMIGDPASRYREDPVRLLRVVRFAAKLGFEIDRATAKPMKAALALLNNVPSSRLFDEMIKLLQTGHAQSSVQALARFEMLPVFPILGVALGHAAGSTAARFVGLALSDTDRRVGEDKPVAPSFLLACLLWEEVRQRWSENRAEGMAPVPSLQAAIEGVFEARVGDISGRGKLASDMREIWLMQPRFERRSGAGPHAMVEQPRFRAAFDFLRLRCDAGELDAELAEWWEDFSLGSPEDREALMIAARPQPVARRLRHPQPGADAQSQRSQGPSAGVADEPDAGPQDPAPRKRRRRRRRPGDGSSGPGSDGEP